MLTFTFVSAEVIETEVISTTVVWFFGSRKKTLQIKNVWSLKYSILREVLWVQFQRINEKGGVLENKDRI